MNKKEVDWPQQLFIKHGNLFLKLLQNRAESTKLEVDGLIRIFEGFNVPGILEFLTLRVESAATRSR